MARPRRQTYPLETYLEDNKGGDISNDADTQRKPAWKPIINGLIVTVLTDDYIPPIILAEEEEDTTLHILDGGSRTAALMMFRYGNYKITSSVENSVITYKKKTKDKNGNSILEEASFDIKGKTYTQLPDELKKKFNKYQLETVVHEHCDRSMMTKYIKRYNEHSAMTTNQKGFTYIDKFAEKIHKIMDSKFFINCNVYSNNDKDKGIVERIIVETMMCMNHFDNWKKQAKTVFKYMNDYATEEEFDKFALNLHRLENIITEDIKDIFNKKDSFIFLTLFDKFTQLGIDDKKFADFLREFRGNLRNHVRNGKGLLFDEIDKDAGTKDKQVVIDKLEMLENLMLEFLHITKEEKEGLTITSQDIVKEYIDENVSNDEMNLYEIEANDVSEVIEDIDSDFLSNKNRSSFVALVTYAYKNNISNELRVWLPVFEKNGVLISNQKQNYLYMKSEFDDFLYKRENKLYKENLKYVPDKLCVENGREVLQ